MFNVVNFEGTLVCTSVGINSVMEPNCFGNRANQLTIVTVGEIYVHTRILHQPIEFLFLYSLLPFNHSNFKLFCYFC